MDTKDLLTSLETIEQLFYSAGKKHESHIIRDAITKIAGQVMTARQEIVMSVPAREKILELTYRVEMAIEGRKEGNNGSS